MLDVVDPLEVYKPDSSKWARQQAVQRPFFAILCGSSVSPACLQRMEQEDVPLSCPYCHEKCVPTWIHLAWHCKQVDDLRSQILGTGFSVPTRVFGQRTGWPVQPCTQDERVLAWLCKLRRTCSMSVTREVLHCLLAAARMTLPLSAVGLAADKLPPPSILSLFAQV